MPRQPMPRVTDAAINRALKAMNDARGLTYPDVGHTRWSDIRGDGRYRPSLWVIISEGGGVASSTLNRATRRETLAVIERMTAKAREA